MEQSIIEPDHEDILTFWLDEGGPEAWYRSDPAYDTRIRERYGALWERARAGGLDGWMAGPRRCLALLILLDQFPRNMFRGDGRSFATDAKALVVATSAIRRGLDRRVELPAKQFFFMPLMHSEVASVQDRCVRLFLLNDPGGSNLDHARAHREVIRRFGRFPYRNDALGRKTTPQEQAFLDAGGYRSALKDVKA